MNFLSISDRTAPPLSRPQTTAEPAYIDFDPKGLHDLFVTDVDNKYCPSFASNGQFPVMESKGNRDGCVFSNSNIDPVSYDVYKDHKNQTVKIYQEAGSGKEGSGVMVAKSGKQCLVLTAEHVVDTGTNNKPALRASLSGATTGDPNVSTVTAAADYPATVKKLDPKHDLALISVNMGADAAQCKPVTVATNPDISAGNHVVSLGYPGLSTSVYASPAESQGPVSLKTILGNKPSKHDYTKGEDFNRTLMRVDGLSVPGDSGGPTFDKDGNLMGIVDRADSWSEADITPVDQAMIKRMIK